MSAANNHGKTKTSPSENESVNAPRMTLRLWHLPGPLWGPLHQQAWAPAPSL